MLRVVAAIALFLASATSAAAMTILPGFHSASGNIRCFVVPIAGSSSSTLRCEIRTATYAKRLQARCMRPDGSGVDWHGFELGARSKGAVTCSGGILYNPGMQRPDFVNLPAGKAWRHRPFECRARRDGAITCTNANRHGLLISRRQWLAW